MTTSPPRPADRYGDRPTRRWWIVAAAAVATAVVVAAVVFIARASDAQIRATTLSWSAPQDDTMTAQIEVVRRPDTVVSCDVVAVDIRQVIVGQAELIVPATSERRQVLSVDIPLQGDGVAAEVRGCTPSE